MNIAIPTDVAEAAIFKAFDQIKVSERDRILSIIEEHAQRYSRGSVTRVALDNLALEIKERR